MNWKIHGSVIGVMFVLITVMYFIMKPGTPVTTGENLGDNYIRISEAHWGLNCNENYKAYLRRKAALGNKPAEGPEPQPVLKNNILPRLSSLCDIKSKCEFVANSITLGEAYQYCTKDLYISWRCTTYERLRTFKGYEGDTVSIDCSPSALAAPAK